MELRAEFKDGGCVLRMIPSDEWEQRLLGAVAKGGDKLLASIVYQPEGHFTYGKCSAVKIVLSAEQHENSRQD